MPGVGRGGPGFWSRCRVVGVAWVDGWGGGCGGVGGVVLGVGGCG